ncbi:hypothetical protein [Rhodanobacter koreensis]
MSGNLQGCVDGQSIDIGRGHPHAQSIPNGIDGFVPEFGPLIRPGLGIRSATEKAVDGPVEQALQPRRRRSRVRHGETTITLPK